MSVFPNWCRSAQKQFSNPRVRLSLGQAQEVLAAGLGHRTYASFRSSDLAALERTAYALVSFDAMKRRATEFGAELSDDACHSALHGMRFGAQGQGRYVIPDTNLGLIFKILVSDSDHPMRGEIARELEAEINGIDAGYGEPCTPWDLSTAAWRWRGRGAFQFMTEEKDLAVPIDIEIEFRRLGRHLFATGAIVSVERAGEAQEFEAEEVLDFHYLPEDK
jgi:hypothetical protein